MISTVVIAAHLRLNAAASIGSFFVLCIHVPYGQTIQASDQEDACCDPTYCLEPVPQMHQLRQYNRKLFQRKAGREMRYDGDTLVNILDSTTHEGY
jgi:hypothetical protein